MKVSLATAAGERLRVEMMHELDKPPKNSREVVWKSEWTAKTESGTMRDLVWQRNIVFAKQRAIKNATLESLSYSLTASHLSQFSSSNQVPRQTFRAYHRFCFFNSLPVFPLYPAMIALCVYNRVSLAGGNPRTFARELERIMAATEEVWEGDRGAGEVKRYDQGGSALKAFMAERATEGEHDGRQSGSPKGKEREELSSDEESEAETMDLDDRYEESSGAESEGPVQRGGSQPLVFPDMPSLDAVFSSLDDAHAAFVVAVVPINGTAVTLRHRFPTNGQLVCSRSRTRRGKTPDGGRCPFRISLSLSEKKGGWVATASRTCLEHNHGPHPNFVKDPSWRPSLRNPKAILALAAADKRGRSSEAVGAGRVCRFKQTSTTAALPPSKRARESSSHAKSASTNSPLTDSPSTFSAPLSQSETAFNTPHSPNLVNIDPLPAFLASLNPSLIPLAPHLLAAGVSSPASVIELSLLDPSQLELFVEALRKNDEDELSRPAGAGRISALQAKLLVKGLAGKV